MSTLMDADRRISNARALIRADVGADDQRESALDLRASAFSHSSNFTSTGLFIYYNVPSTRYQDQLIGMLAFGWAAWLWELGRDPSAHLRQIKTLLIAGAVALVTLCRINLAADFGLFVVGPRLRMFWLEILSLAAYLGWLAWLAREQGRG